MEWCQTPKAETPIDKPGATARPPFTTSRRKRVRFSKLPPYSPSRVCALQKLVAEITVTMLDIDEIETCFPGDDCRSLKVFDNLPDTVVCQHGIIFRDPESPVENRMVVED